jgi:hypothetical protein
MVINSQIRLGRSFVASAFFGIRVNQLVAATSADHQKFMQTLGRLVKQ